MEQKIKSFIIESGIFNVAAIAEKTGIERTRLHRWLNHDKKMTVAEVANLGILLRQFGFKK